MVRVSDYANYCLNIQSTYSWLTCNKNSGGGSRNTVKMLEPHLLSHSPHVLMQGDQANKNHQFSKMKRMISVLRQAPTLTSCVPTHACMSRNCHPIPFQCQVINPPQKSVNPDLTLFHKMWLFFRFCVNARNWSLYVKGMLPTHRAQFKIGLI